MKKEKKLTKKEMLEILDKFKKLVGLSDYSIYLTEDKITDGHLAEANLDDLEKEIYVVLGPPFFKLPNYKKRNVLIHEMIHSRVNLFNIRVDKLKNYEEETLVNDLTRGLELIK